MWARLANQYQVIMPSLLPNVPSRLTEKGALSQPICIQ